MKKHTKKIILSAGALALTVGVTWLFSLTVVNRDSQQASIRLSRNSRETLCTATTPEYCGRIVIRKDATPDSYQDFYFTHNVPGYASPVTLDDDATLSSPPPSTTSNMAVLLTPYNGVYWVAETSNPNFAVSVSCTDPTGGTMTGNNSAVVTITNGETVQCTFTNSDITGGLTGTLGGSTGATIVTETDPGKGDGTYGAVVDTDIDTDKEETSFCPDAWTQKANFVGGNTVSAFGFSIGSKGYIGAGMTGSSNVQEDFWQYDPATNVWTQKANFGGGPRLTAIGFSIGEKGYAGTGVYNSSKQDFWEYDPATNVWTQKANFGGGPRKSAVGFSMGGKGYIGIGQNGSDYKQDLWEYTPGPGDMGGSWTQKANFGGGDRAAAVGLSIGNKGYVGMGITEDGQDTEDFWEYNPATNSWTQKANFGGGSRVTPVGFSIGDKGYVGTGRDSYYNLDALQDFWEFDPGADWDGEWTPKANFGGGDRVLAVGFSIGNKGYLGLGGPDNTMSGVGSLSDFWEYCP